MGIKITVGGLTLEARDYSVSESATPLSAGDSRGGVGSISFSVPALDPDLNPTPEAGGGFSGTRDLLLAIGPQALIGETVRLVDGRRGLIVGRVVNAIEDVSAGEWEIECETRLADLSIYNVTAAPFTGTLRAAFQYYTDIAGVDDVDIWVDPSIADRIVSYPGWQGELWYQLKRIAIAQDSDIALTSGIILLRPVRSRQAVLDSATGLRRDAGTGELAQAIEIYVYNNEPIVNKLVWPTMGETDTYSVNAGEVSEYGVEFSASLTELSQPVAQDWVSPYEVSASVYSVIDGSGNRIPADLWQLYGGRVEVILQEDMSTARLIITGPEGITIGEETPTSFSLADFADGDGARRPTLRLIGSGVRYTPELLRVPTSVPPSRTETDVGITVNNPFISTHNEAYRAGVRAAQGYTGYSPSISASVIAVNRRGDGGQADGNTYGQVEALLKDQHGANVTYGQLDAEFTDLTYGEVTELLVNLGRNPFQVQLFGNAAGARVWDRGSRRWYRIREASISSDPVQIEADDDLLHSDVEEHLAPLDYAGVAERFSGLTYQQVGRLGLYG